jgi:DNA-binding CsgD family transcriptional regulator
VQGKSKGDIASILGIRRSTVVFHLENAKRKLGVRVVPQAVARFASSA